VSLYCLVSIEGGGRRHVWDTRSQALGLPAYHHDIDEGERLWDEVSFTAVRFPYAEVGMAVTIDLYYDEASTHAVRMLEGVVASVEHGIGWPLVRCVSTYQAEVIRMPRITEEDWGPTPKTVGQKGCPESSKGEPYVYVYGEPGKLPYGRTDPTTGEAVHDIIAAVPMPVVQETAAVLNQAEIDLWQNDVDNFVRLELAGIESPTVIDEQNALDEAIAEFGTQPPVQLGLAPCTLLYTLDWPAVDADVTIVADIDDRRRVFASRTWREVVGGKRVTLVRLDQHAEWNELRRARSFWSSTQLRTAHRPEKLGLPAVLGGWVGADFSVRDLVADRCQDGPWVWRNGRVSPVDWRCLSPIARISLASNPHSEWQDAGGNNSAIELKWGHSHRQGRHIRTSEVQTGAVVSSDASSFETADIWDSATAAHFVLHLARRNGPRREVTVQLASDSAPGRSIMRRGAGVCVMVQSDQGTHAMLVRSISAAPRERIAVTLERPIGAAPSAVAET